MTGFNNRWDHEGEMADERSNMKEEVAAPQPPTYMEERRLYMQSKSDKSCKGEKRGNTTKITQTRDILVLASSPSVSPWVTKHDLSVSYPRCDSILAGTGVQ